MTTPAKFLVILILLLSLGFAVISAVQFVQRRDWKAAQEASETARSADAKLFEQKKAQMQTDLDMVSREKDQLHNQNQSLQTRISELNTQVAALDKEKSDWRSRFDTLNSKLEGWVELQKQWSAQVESLKAEVFKRDAEILAKTRELSERDTTIHELRKGAEELQAQLDGVKMKLALANKTVDQLQKVLDVIYERFIEVRSVIDTGVPLPDIQGKVLYVNQDTGNVIINVGLKQGVRRNYEFTVYRGAEFIGKIRIIDLRDEDMAAGKILNKKTDIQQGDSVATRIAS